jgi:hypothetical protein
MLNKIVNAFLLKNSQNNEPAYIASMVIFGFFIINLKLLFSGIQITHDIKLSEFTGVDYAAAVGALGGIHIFNKKQESNKPKQD